MAGSSLCSGEIGRRGVTRRNGSRKMAEIENDVYQRDVVQFVHQVLCSRSDGTEDLHQSIQGLSARAEPLLCHTEPLLLLLQRLLVSEPWDEEKERDERPELQQVQPPACHF